MNIAPPVATARDPCRGQNGSAEIVTDPKRKALSRSREGPFLEENRGECPGIETVVKLFLAAARDTGS